ncbi:hypothetical protein GUJ93_ZPchr0009g1701 [Zizania palustris]|uniref:Uncharacterized protein n=1 Tax=Zizania palustris TaxID=103762 RepID=A0A8J5UXY9_ZIZPA|nr:hypothetical protein GUJ93_ZPchr0009g1701 [Zizania palustris]
MDRRVMLAGRDEERCMDRAWGGYGGTEVGGANRIADGAVGVRGYGTGRDTGSVTRGAQGTQGPPVTGIRASYCRVYVILFPLERKPRAAATWQPRYR